MSSLDVEACSSRASRRPAAAGRGLPLGAGRCGAPGLALDAVGEPRAGRQRWGCRGRKRQRRDYETRPAGSGAHSSPWAAENLVT